MEVPIEFLSVTATVPWTVPEIENGRCKVVKLPNVVSLPNQTPNKDRTSKDIVEFETEHPGTVPQDNDTTGVVLNVRLSCATSRVVEYRAIDTPNPF